MLLIDSAYGEALEKLCSVFFDEYTSASTDSEKDEAEKNLKSGLPKLDAARKRLVDILGDDGLHNG